MYALNNNNKKRNIYTEKKLINCEKKWVFNGNVLFSVRHWCAIKKVVLHIYCLYVFRCCVITENGEFGIGTQSLHKRVWEENTHAWLNLSEDWNNWSACVHRVYVPHRKAQNLWIEYPFFWWKMAKNFTYTRPNVFMQSENFVL